MERGLVGYATSYRYASYSKRTHTIVREHTL